MSKLAETNALIDTMTRLAEAGISADLQQSTILLDIAKSLAIIADKLSEVVEDGENT